MPANRRNAPMTSRRVRAAPWRSGRPELGIACPPDKATTRTSNACLALVWRRLCDYLLRIPKIPATCRPLGAGARPDQRDRARLDADLPLAAFLAREAGLAGLRAGRLAAGLPRTGLAAGLRAGFTEVDLRAACFCLAAATRFPAAGRLAAVRLAAGLAAPRRLLPAAARLGGCGLAFGRVAWTGGLTGFAAALAAAGLAATGGLAGTALGGGAFATAGLAPG